MTAVVQFVTAWAVLGGNREDYASASQAVSELADIGSPTREETTASLILFGLLVAPFAPTLLGALKPRASKAKQPVPGADRVADSWPFPVAASDVTVSELL